MTWEVDVFRKSSYSMNNGNCVECCEWFKSSYSETGNCVEWRKSSRSYGTGNCVEVCHGVQIRDSKNPDGVILKFNAVAWGKFIATLK